MKWILAISALALTACATGEEGEYGADDFAAGLLCGARQERCQDQCEEVEARSSDVFAYGDCIDRCIESRGDACR